MSTQAKQRGQKENERAKCEVKRKERGMENFSKFNPSCSKRSSPLSLCITEDSMTK